MMPEQLSRTTVYESEWINLYIDHVKLPYKRLIDKHHFLDFPKTSVAALVENEKAELLLIQAYRYTTGSIEWEIPAGWCENTETIISTAQREVLEETGYLTEKHSPVYKFNPLIGISNAIHHIVYCRAVQQVADFDRNEVNSTHWVPIPEVRNMIKEQQIFDGLSLMALLIFLTQEDKIHEDE
jgi:ADP-ribose pyrophosphatase